MTGRSRDFYFVVLGQAACVAVGLWMQHYMLRRDIHAAIEHHLRADLMTIARERLRAVTTSGSDPAPPGEGAEPLFAGFSTPACPNTRCAVCDTDWRPLAIVSSDGPAIAIEQAGCPWTWEPLEEAAPPTGEPQAGTLKTSAGPQLAAAAVLGGKGRTLVVYRPAADVAAAAAPLVRGLPAVGFVTLLWCAALLSITAYLVSARHRDVLHHERTRSVSAALQHTQRLVQTRDTVIFALAKLAGSRDHETGEHLERISEYCTTLAAALRDVPQFTREVTPAFVRMIGLSSVLHDIGKVGIEDGILRKPGPLTTDERQRMQQHTVIANECLADIARRLGGSDFLRMAREIALSHHEHWDGGGYPHGLRGTHIPLSARIAAIADVYDALATPRVYKQPLPHDQCVATIQAGAGRQFDPDLVAAWLTVAGQFREIAQRQAHGPPRQPAGHFVPTPCAPPVPPTDGPAQAETPDVSSAANLDDAGVPNVTPTGAEPWTES